MLEFCDFYILFSINSTLMDDLHILDVKTEAQLKQITYFLLVCMQFIFNHLQCITGPALVAISTLLVPSLL